MWYLLWMEHMYVNSVWQGLYLRMGTKKTCVKMSMDYVLKLC